MLISLETITYEKLYLLRSQPHSQRHNNNLIVTAFPFVQKKRKTDVVQKVRTLLALCQGLDTKKCG